MYYRMSQYYIIFPCIGYYMNILSIVMLFYLTIYIYIYKHISIACENTEEQFYRCAVTWALDKKD